MEKIEGQQPLLQGTPGQGTPEGCVVPRQREARGRLQEGGRRRGGTRAGHQQGLGSGDSTSAPSTYIPWLFKAGLSPEEVSTNFLLSVHTQLQEFAC